MSNKSAIQLLNVVAANISTFSGAVRATGIAVPDEKIYTAGSLKVIDPVHLRPFLAFRRSVDRSCLAVGARFLSGFAVPDDALDVLLVQFAEMEGKVQSAKGVLIRNYDEYVEQWAKAHPASMNEILDRAPPVSYLERQIGFSVAVYKVNSQAEKVTAAGVNDGIQREIEGLAGQIAYEIATDVAESWSPKADKASQKVRGLLERVVNKARGLSFIDSRLHDLAQFIETTAATIPARGAIEGRDFLVLNGLMSVLTSEKRILSGDLTLKIEDDRIGDMFEAQGNPEGNAQPEAKQAAAPPAPDLFSF